MYSGWFYFIKKSSSSNFHKMFNKQTISSSTSYHNNNLYPFKVIECGWFIVQSGSSDMLDRKKKKHIFMVLWYTYVQCNWNTSLNRIALSVTKLLWNPTTFFQQQKTSNKNKYSWKGIWPGNVVKNLRGAWLYRKVNIFKTWFGNTRFADFRIQFIQLYMYL